MDFSCAFKMVLLSNEEYFCNFIFKSAIFESARNNIKIFCAAIFIVSGAAAFEEKEI